MSIPFPYAGYSEKCRKRVRVVYGGHTLVDTRRSRLVWEHVFYPVYYVPLDDVDEIFFEHSGGNAVADTYDIIAGGRRSVNAAQLFKKGDMKGWLKIAPDKVDHWFEEDEEIYLHPKDPYKRVDVLQSSREVSIQVDGVEIARSTKARLMYETGLPVRTYIPKTDVHLEYLEPSDLISACPYKGVANYYNVRLPKGLTMDGLVWWYRNPNAECIDIKGYVAFYDERVDVFVDGVLVPRPRTRFG
ncbi:DUF427-domain-containing protein [Vararia minispora EC-137]|uniref:DUF427-domain-containing protein n=1 Tax=Vararia minispora EC-137 TaxID=1314806 RepID=A0ACB8QI24_9AGAM|nr:DUF427-domain-containing protein [Vararia minispora EC-137]